MTDLSITRVAHEDAAQSLGQAGDAPAWMLRTLAMTNLLFRIQSPATPGLVCIGATIVLDETQACAFGAGAISGTGTGVDMAGAVAGCLGELAEFLSQFEQDGDLVANASALRPLDDGWLGAAIAGKQIADWARARDLLSGADHLVPADLCFRRTPKRRALDPVGPLSAGCATGRTFDEAATRAIFELIERDAAALWRFGGRRARVISHDHPAAADAAAFLAQLRQGDPSRQTVLLDITTDIGAPAIAAASYDAGGRGFACGLAARAEPAEAAKAALCELGQMELATALAQARLAEGGKALLNDIDRRHLKRAAQQINQSSLLIADDDPAQGADQHPTIERGLPPLLRHLADRSISIYLVDLARPLTSAPAVRAIAPRLQPFVKHILTPRLAAAAPGGGVHDEPLLY